MLWPGMAWHDSEGVSFLNAAGPILAQEVVPVYPTDSPQQVAARVLKMVSAVQWPLLQPTPRQRTIKA